jgi:hypothetical protein
MSLMVIFLARCLHGRCWVCRFIVAVAVCATFQGCADFASMAETLNARQVQSCVYVQGGYGLFAGARVVTATGGVSIETCLREER